MQDGPRYSLAAASGVHLTQPDAVSAADAPVLADEAAAIVHLVPEHVMRDVSGRDAGGNALQLELGPQYLVTHRVTLGGEWEHFQPFQISGRPDLEQYSFALRVAF